MTNIIKKTRNKILRKYFYKFVEANSCATSQIYKNVTIYTVKNAKIFASFDNRTLILNNKGQVLKESCENLECEDHIMPKFPINYNKYETVNLKCAVNLALCFNDNFWHFTFNVLDKIQILNEMGFNGTFIVFDRLHIREYIKFLKIPLERVIFVQPKTLYCVDELFVFNRHALRTCPLTINFLKKITDKITNDFEFDKKYPKRIFVKRIGTRKIKNETEVLNLLQKYGFETIIPENLSLEEQIKHFKCADIVVTCHGANSTNCAYMRENTHFIECFGKFLNSPCCFGILKEKNIKYHMLAEKSNFSHEKYKKNYNTWLKDFNVNIEHLELILDGILK